MVIDFGLGPIPIFPDFILACLAIFGVCGYYFYKKIIKGDDD